MTKASCKKPQTGIAVARLPGENDLGADGKMAGESLGEIWRRYSRDIREKARASDLTVPVAGGVFFSGVAFAAFDLIGLQQMAHRFDLVSLTGLVLLAVGSALLVQARRTLGKHFSPVVRILPDHRLITYGVYRYIRHPGYLGEVLLYLSVPLLLHSLYGFILMLFIIPSILYRIGVQEWVLLERFGDQYRDYMKRSKRFVPYVC